MKQIFLTTTFIFTIIVVKSQVLITTPQPEAPYDYLSVVDDQIFFGGEGASRTERERWMHYRIFSLSDSLAPPREIDIKEPFIDSKELHYLRSAVAFEDHCYEVYFMKGEGRQHHLILRRNLRTLEMDGTVLDIDSDSKITLLADATGVQIMTGPDKNGTGFYRYNPDLSEGTSLNYAKLNANDITIHSSALDQYGNLILTGSYIVKRKINSANETVEVVIVNDIEGKSHLIVPVADVAFTFSATDYTYNNGELTAMFYTQVDGVKAGFRIATWNEEGQMQGSSIAGTFSLDEVMNDELKAGLEAEKVKMEKVAENGIDVGGNRVFHIGDKYILCGQRLTIGGRYLNNYNLIAVVSKEGKILSQHLVPRRSSDYGEMADFAVGNGLIKVFVTLKSNNVQNGRFIYNPADKKGFDQLFARTIEIETGIDHGFIPVTTEEMKGYNKFVELNERSSDDEVEAFKLWNTRANKNRYLICIW